MTRTRPAVLSLALISCAAFAQLSNPHPNPQLDAMSGDQLLASLGGKQTAR